MPNFWKKLKNPFFVLAPMDDATDVVFRQVVYQTCRPDVFFTEFTNVDGLASKGKEKLMPRLSLAQNEHPIVAQIWGKVPENYFQAAQMIKEMSFDGIDINMGCPERGVVRQGNCAGLIKDPQRAKEIIQATKEGAGHLPVSVKTRLGFNEYQIKDWIGFLLGQSLDALTVHGRTVKEMSKAPANWEAIKEVVKLKNQISKDTIIIGNGDIASFAQGLEKVKEFGVDGVMIGRGIFHDPWIFAKAPKDHSLKERLGLLLFHARLFDKTWGKTKNFNILKKFFKIYVSGFDGASELRVELMEAQTLEQVEKAVGEFLDPST